MTVRHLIAPLAVCACFAATPGHAAPAEAPTWGLAIKGGILMEGEVTIDDGDSAFDVDTESGWLLILEAERWVNDGLSVGVFGLHTSVDIEDADIEASIITVGVTLKTRFHLGGGVDLRPGIAVGYQRITADGGGEEDPDPTAGLDVGGMVDLAFTSATSTRFVGTLGFITQPAGGNDDYELTFEPIFYLAGGIEFGG